MAKARKKPVDVLADPIAPEDSGANPIAPQDSGDTTAAVNRDRIESRAYELYMARGGQHGRALEDWLEAEQELLQATRRTRDRD
jgi:hypothetical protein